MIKMAVMFRDVAGVVFGVGGWYWVGDGDGNYMEYKERSLMLFIVHLTLQLKKYFPLKILQ